MGDTFEEAIPFVCECKSSGFCKKHGIFKGLNEYKLCKGGPNVNVERRRKYLMEKLVSSLNNSPDAIMSSEPIVPVYFNRLQSYPALCMEPLVNPVKHLLFHILPIASNRWIWQRAIDKLSQKIEQFNGKKVVAIALANNKSAISTDSPDTVISYFEQKGIKDVEFLVVENIPTLREVTSFVSLLKKVETMDPQHCVFYGHAKGVTHESKDSICHVWADAMYETVYRNWDQVKIALENYGIAGSFKKYGEFKSPENHKWHYSGTFYWFRCASVFNRDWTKIDKKFYGSESWPGHIFRPEEAACLFWDYCCDLYKVKAEEYQRRLLEWRLRAKTTPNPEEYLNELRKNNVPAIFSK